MKKFLISIISGIVLFSTAANAQKEMTVTGTVKDSRGESVIGATIMVEGTSTGTLTNIDGKYTISFVPKAGTKPALVFSSLSYLSQTVQVGTRGVIDVTLEDDNEQLEEVVVIGYGAMKKSDITGSVASVKIDENVARQSSSIDQLLQGQAAGVQVVSNSAAPDAGVSVTIRGASSFNSNSQPLYVVDGVILNTESSTTLGTHGGQDSGISEETNGLMGISPQDIASMEVLKDASATAIYGSQGANGVILITTKSAEKEKPSISFSAGVSLANIYKKFEVMDYQEYKIYLDKKGVSHSDETYKIFTEGVESGRYIPIDWQDYATRLSVTQRYNLSISGKPNNTNYRFSIGYNNNQGVIKGTGYDNLTMRLNLEKTFKKLSFGTKTSFSYFHSNMTQGAGSTIVQSPSSSMVLSMLMTRPLMYAKEYDSEGIELDDEGAPISGPDRWLTDYQSERTEIRVTPSLFLQYKALPWLTLKTTIGGDYRSQERLRFKSIRINTQATGSTGAVAHQDRLNWNWDNLIMMAKRFGKHYVSGTLGHSMHQYTSRSETVEGTNVEQWKSMVESLNSAPYTWLTYGEGSSQTMSFFARTVYTYKNRYILTATYRFDGTSKFYGDNKWAQFPSLALAWRFNKEPWFDLPSINSAKLRLGWGKVGNQKIASYQTNYTFSTSATGTHDNESGKQVTITSFNIPQRDLKWETTTQYNTGLDLEFFKGRLLFALDAYYKLTDDLLQIKTLPGSSGVSNPYVNMGAISNKGFEISLSGTPIAKKQMEWTIGGNISLNRNKIISIDPTGASRGQMYLHVGEPIRTVDYFSGNLLSQDSFCHDYINVFIAGQPMCLFYGMPTDGLVQEGQMGVPFADGAFRGAGAINFIDTNGDGVITAEDRVIIGDPNPDFTYGFNTSFRWKKLTVSAAFNGSYGNDLYNQQAATLSDMSTLSMNRFKALVYDSWTPENPNAKYPSFSAYTISDYNWCTDRFVEDGSYLRMSNLSINYGIPVKDKKSPLRYMSVGLSGKNIFVITKYSGYDPEVNSYGNVLKYGIDNGSYPAARTYMLDLKFNF